MIIVGAVDQDGKVWNVPNTGTGTVTDPSGLITVWSPGDNIPGPGLGDVIPTNEIQSGTSQAAAIVVCLHKECCNTF
jgi:hypothetical protein